MMPPGGHDGEVIPVRNMRIFFIIIASAFFLCGCNDTKPVTLLFTCDVKGRVDPVG
jgi:hypothetical protein